MAYSKTCVKLLLSKRPQNSFARQLSLNAGQSIAECSAILSTVIKLPFVIRVFVLSIFDWPFYTGFTVLLFDQCTKSSHFDSHPASFMLIVSRLYQLKLCHLTIFAIDCY